MFSIGICPATRAPQQTEFGYESASGNKIGELAFSRELDGYLAKCAFINHWPRHGDVNGVPAHEAPFDLCLVSIDPTIIVGVEKGPNGSGAVPRDRGARPFVGSAYLLGIIEARVDLPYHARANIIWFSPAEDHGLHHLDLRRGKGGFTVAGSTRMTVTAEADVLKTFREVR